MPRIIPLAILALLMPVTSSLEAQINPTGFRHASAAKQKTLPPIVAATPGNWVSSQDTAAAKALQGTVTGNAANCEQCAPRSDRYVSVFGGFLNQQEYENTIATSGPPFGTNRFDVVLNTNPGWAVGGALGRRFNNGFRMESEFVYRNATMDTISAALFPVPGPLGSVPVNGTVNAYSTMVNLAYDFNRQGRISPYVGAGVGATFIEYTFNVAAIPATIDIELPTVSFQYFAGVSAQVSARAEAFVEYRAHGTQEFELNINAGPTNLSSEFDSLNHSVLAGLRLNLR